jgi:serine/threonine protein kinase/alpha-tubulin suppressor-like RCC1 family protein
MGCFSRLQTAGEVCPMCEYSPNTQLEHLYQLPSRTILSGKYMVGRVLGEGGFGITYVGYDLNLDMKVAIKEYYPSGFVMRDTSASTTVQTYAGEQGDIFRKGRERFVDEAKRLARFRVFAGIVMVNDFFVENGTAYIVMEYVEGVTLKSYIAQMGGKLPAEQFFEMLRPLFGSLAQVHESGIIHRDISPDNIMITPDGNVKLLDFGAAREFGDGDNKSLSVLLKHGYAPVEQYQTKGKQGPHTDVYALSATIYKAITGITPESSMDRIVEENLEPPSRLGVNLPDYQEAALMKGLAIRQADRYQTISELYAALMPPMLASVQTIPIATAIPYEQPENIQLSSVATQRPDAPALSSSTSPNTSDALPLVQSKSIADPTADNAAAARETAIPQKSHTDDADALISAPKPKQSIKMSKNSKIIAATVTACLVIAVVFAFSTLLTDSPEVPDNSGVINGAEGEETSSVIAMPDNSGVINGVEGEENAETSSVIKATVLGLNNFGEYDESEWEDIIAVSAGYRHAVGLRSDGSVVAVGNNEDGRCDVYDWNDIIAIEAGYHHTVGLKANGTVVAAGNNSFGECDVSEWRNIMAISVGRYHTVGLKDDGTVVVTGSTDYGLHNVAELRDIVAVSAANSFNVVLKSDGSIVISGQNEFSMIEYMEDGNALLVAGWQDIVAIAAASGPADTRLIGLRSDGTAVSVGSHGGVTYNVSHWRDIVAISLGYEYAIGLKSDGTVVMVGRRDRELTDFSGLRNVTAISAGSYYVIAITSGDAESSASVNDDSSTNYASAQVGDTIEFGGYDWRVLDIQDGKALILSELVLERRAYHETYEREDITWENSDIRHYLNGDFLRSFSESDRARIAETRVVNNDNPWTSAHWGLLDNTPGGNDTTDKIFLLSIDEVVCFFGDSGMLAQGVDENARDFDLKSPAQGIYWWGFSDQYNDARIAHNPHSGASWWWLRSSGGYSYFAATVDIDGILSVHGSQVYVADGVRPALWLNL